MNTTNIIESKAKAIYEHIVQNRAPLMGDRRIKDFDEEELKTFVESEFNDYGLHFMVIGNFDQYGGAKISLDLSTSRCLKSTEELKRCLDASVVGYLREIEDAMTECKNRVYKRLQRYQVDQKPDAFE